LLITTGMRRRTALLAALTLTACVGTEDIGKTEHSLSRPGPWDIPAETAAIGDTMSVEYTGAGPWVGTSGCGSSLLPGAAELRTWLMAAYPQIQSIGGYSCRHINGDSSRMSVHATGRALDIMLPLHSGDADNDLGDPIGNWLIEHAEEIGIQYIIWDRWTWSGSRSAGNKERSYGGAHPHHDHLHVELSVDGAAMRTPWFGGAMEPPATDCEALGADGGTIEETSDCFAAYGPATYWRTESAGHGGSMLWTNAFENDSPSNWARWHLNLDAGGEYAVEIYAESAYAVNRSTRYALRHGDVEHEMEVDLSGADGWVRLGTFEFAPGGGQHLSVYDNTTGPVGSDQHIPADAVRLIPAGRTEPPVEPMEPTDPMEPGPRVRSVTELPIWVEQHIEGGDPTLDDDPLEGPGRLRATGGCSVGASGGPGALWVVGLLGLVALRRRR